MDVVPGRREKSLYHVASCWFRESGLKSSHSFTLTNLSPSAAESQVVFAHRFVFRLWQFKVLFTVLCMIAKAACLE